ncbi:MAG: fibronectin type III domain-containing protein [Chloroflexaceae bacterium]|nr:fibronectin type III domain-containing protein [Chloroflexaceae bacterium]
MIPTVASHADHSHHDHAAHLAATLAQLAVPANLSVRQDDRAAVLQWDFDQANPTRPLPSGVAGYRITWGPASQPEANVRLTQHRRIQLQPLENGQPYVARVQAVDNFGRLSTPSAPISFTGDGTRVEALRTRMNGFFDDFNLPQGGADERKWNTAYSLCNAPEGNGYFINPQFHVHNTIFSRDCDRGQQHNRARALLDFSDNGTRTITFDFDGVFHRNIWYLDLMPNLSDIYGPERFPPGGLRFSQNNQTLEIRRFDANGSEVTIAIFHRC